jgi:hypothetical protein
MAELLEPGDIVRFEARFLGRVTGVVPSPLAPISGTLVSIEALEADLGWSFGMHCAPLDAAMVEFMARGTVPGAVVEDLGMEHPWIMARMQARIDASFALQSGLGFVEALAMAESRAADLFGDVPRGWVATAVAKAFANDADDPRAYR